MTNSQILAQTDRPGQSDRDRSHICQSQRNYEFDYQRLQEWLAEFGPHPFCVGRTLSAYSQLSIARELVDKVVLLQRFGAIAMRSSAAQQRSQSFA